jgi:hypothetical protein
MVGTNVTGLFTLRPDFVRVGSGVYESETSESALSFYTVLAYRLRAHHND